MSLVSCLHFPQSGFVHCTWGEIQPNKWGEKDHKRCCEGWTWWGKQISETWDMYSMTEIWEGGGETRRRSDRGKREQKRGGKGNSEAGNIKPDGQSETRKLIYIFLKREKQDNLCERETSNVWGKGNVRTMRRRSQGTWGEREQEKPEMKERPETWRKNREFKERAERERPAM